MEHPPSPRARDVAVLLPLLGVFLWMPPFVALFTGGARPWGVPLVVAYLFGAWAALLVGAALLARALRPHPPADAAGEGDTAGPPAEAGAPPS